MRWSAAGRDLTEPKRIGTAEAPWKLGDQVLVTYQLTTERPHSYIEVEDQLPACLETVNPKLPLIAEYYKLPVEAGVNTLPLSHVEQRTAATNAQLEKDPSRTERLFGARTSGCGRNLPLAGDATPAHATVASSVSPIPRLFTALNKMNGTRPDAPVVEARLPRR